MLNAEKMIADGLSKNNIKFNRYSKLSEIHNKTFDSTTIVIENEYGESNLLISFNEKIKVSFIRWNQNFELSNKGVNEALNSVLKLLTNKACIIEYSGTTMLNQYLETDISAPLFYNTMINTMEIFLSQNTNYMQGWAHCWDDTKSLEVGSPVMEKLMIEKLTNLYDSIENNSFHSERKEMFAGCSLIVTNNPASNFPNDNVFVSQDALFISQVIFTVWDICKPYYDDFRKDDFFCGIAGVLLNGQRANHTTKELVLLMVRNVIEFIQCGE